MKKLAALLCALLLVGCGFQLRGGANLPFETLYVQAPAGSQFALQLKRIVHASDGTRIVDTQKEAAYTLILIQELREKTIMSLSGGGRVREFQFRYRASYRMLDKAGVETLPTTEIVLTRDFSFNDEATLSKEYEEALLFRDMQNDAVQQLVRRLQVVKLAQP
jgi:LPS-assembly lipoprotein